MLSPVETTTEFFTSERSCLTCVARYAAPPASTVVPSASTTRPDEPVGGSRLPWKSLKPIIRTWTGVGVGLGCLPRWASAPVAPSDPKVNATAATTAARRSQVRLESSLIRQLLGCGRQYPRSLTDVTRG